MLFKNLWCDPKEVVAMFVDVELKRGRVKLSKPELHEICTDLESAQLLLKYLDDNDPTKPKKP